MYRNYRHRKTTIQRQLINTLIIESLDRQENEVQRTGEMVIEQEQSPKNNQLIILAIPKPERLVQKTVQLLLETRLSPENVL